jgi:hypothetical protein
MRIISDFHDYYDAVQAAGQDQTLVYCRKRAETTVSHYPLPVLRLSFLQNLPAIEIQQHIVGFCGKIYPVLVLTHAASTKTAICHNLGEVDAFLEDTCRKREMQEYRAEASPYRRRRRWLDDCPRIAFEKHFAECLQEKDAFVEMFIEKQCPVLIGTVLDVSRRGRRARKGKIVYNGSLKELEFFRLFDTYKAFQEIAMFLGGLAVPLKEIPKVPDKIMVGIKGFDDWSFRKPPRDK